MARVEEVSFEVPKGLGNTIGNVLRDVSMVETPSWRPIAFKLEEGGNIVHSSDYILEDITSISVELSDAYYECNDNAEYLVVSTDFTKECKLSTICGDKIKLLSDDRVIIHSMNDMSIPITVIFRNTVGKFTIGDNTKFIKHTLNLDDDFSVISSNHVPVKRFSYKVTQKSNKDIVHIQYATVNNDKAILQRSIDLLVKTLTEITILST
ncbi:hypothetical protein [uncultured Clostridium sp.]|uniref:hypothetical protein n=1 Tax=uncultured Clostridium sp. TaxID=59620 RepID=UPI0026F39ACE|nr:hypothetical protein [uncultured Clostridium sp.]